MNLKETFDKLCAGGRIWIILAALALGVGLLLLGGAGDSTGKKAGETEISEYAAELEKRIGELCSQVEGVGRVTVAVSLEGGFENVYATDENGRVITVGSGSSASGIVIKRKPPTIAGVGIVCRGGDDPAVQRRLISLIGAAYGVGSNRIFITESKK